MEKVFVYNYLVGSKVAALPSGGWGLARRAGSRESKALSVY